LRPAKGSASAFAVGMNATLDAIKDAPEAFAARVLQPKRGRLAEVDAALTGLTCAETAWRRLIDRGLVPRAWLDHPTRDFCEPHDVSARGRRPSSIAACRALASDVDGVEAAEAHLLEAVRRLEPWGAPSVERVVWCVGGSPRGSVSRTLAHASVSSFRAEAVDVPWRVWSDEALELGRRVSSSPGVAALEASWDAVAAHWWQIAARERWPALPERFARQPRRVRERLAGRLIRHLASPFDPLLEVWCLGYARGAITARDVTLVVPAVAPLL
jgi:hypothetical protein